MDCSWTWDRLFLNINQLSQAPLPFRTLFPGTMRKRSLKWPKFAFLKSDIVILLFAVLPPLRILNSIIPWSLQPSLSSTFMCPVSVFFFVSTRSSEILPFWLLSHLSQEVVIKVLQEPPGGLLVPCCVFPPAGFRLAKVPHEGQGPWVWGCCQLSAEGWIRLMFLGRWPIGDTHYKLTQTNLVYHPTYGKTTEFGALKVSLHSGLRNGCAFH